MGADVSSGRVSLVEGPYMPAGVLIVGSLDHNTERDDTGLLGRVERLLDHGSAPGVIVTAADARGVIGGAEAAPVRAPSR